MAFQYLALVLLVYVQHVSTKSTSLTVLSPSPSLDHLGPVTIDQTGLNMFTIQQMWMNERLDIFRLVMNQQPSSSSATYEPQYLGSYMTKLGSDVTATTTDTFAGILYTTAAKDQIIAINVTSGSVKVIATIPGARGIVTVDRGDVSYAFVTASNSLYRVDLLTSNIVPICDGTVPYATDVSLDPHDPNIAYVLTSSQQVYRVNPHTGSVVTLSTSSSYSLHIASAAGMFHNSTKDVLIVRLAGIYRIDATSGTLRLMVDKLSIQSPRFIAMFGDTPDTNVAYITSDDTTTIYRLNIQGQALTPISQVDAIKLSRAPTADSSSYVWTPTTAGVSTRDILFLLAGSICTTVGIIVAVIVKKWCRHNKKQRQQQPQHQHQATPLTSPLLDISVNI